MADYEGIAWHLKLIKPAAPSVLDFITKVFQDRESPILESYTGISV